MISVIVPTHNEERLLPSCLESVKDQDLDCELIVADGGSSDATLKIARAANARIVTHREPDLPAQLNAAASSASGELLLFLHADSRLTPGCLSRLAGLDGNIVGGAYTMLLDGNRLFYRILAAGGNIYCRLTHTFFGDRGLFARADVFRRLGGFRRLTIMSDVDFSHRLRQAGRTVLLPGPVISSARKFEDESAAKALYRIIYALIAFRLQRDPEEIRDRYYGNDSR